MYDVKYSIVLHYLVIWVNFVFVKFIKSSLKASLNMNI